MNFPVMKGIKISEEQAKNWDVNLVRNALDSNGSESKDLLQNFKRLYEIMNIWLLGKMTDSQKEKIPEKVLNEIEGIEVILNV